MNYNPTIGLEVHVQLKTASKIFCSCSTSFGSEPNSQVCPVCLGMPGVLPVLNKHVVDLALKAALALNCTVSPVSIFARKNYFYPDLPKGYQISQFENPLAEKGWLEIPDNGSMKRISITRVHLEEDAGKLLHPEGKIDISESRIDINRCGVPLIEIVTEPEISSPQEAYDFLTHLKQTLQYLDVSDCNMEEGSLRCDANVSIKPEDFDKLGTKTELKNLNSFRFVEKALAHEIVRQQEILENGGTVLQQTFAWDAVKNSTVLMRTKEESDDYRYFSEPDLIPLQIAREWIADARESIPELPGAKKKRFIKQYGIPEKNVEILTATRELADYFENTAAEGADSAKAANWILSEVLGILNDKKISISAFPVTPKSLAGLLTLIENGTISGKIAKNVFLDMVETGNPAEKIIERNGLRQITDRREVEKIVDTILQQHTRDVQAYFEGKVKVFGFFVGQVMRNTGGKANPRLVNTILREKLDELKNS